MLHIKKCTSKHVSVASFIVTVTPWFYICKPGQSTGAQCVSLCWQHECEPPGNREAVWNAASRLDTVETVAATTAHNKNEHWALDVDTEACDVSKQGLPALQRLNKRS